MNSQEMEPTSPAVGKWRSWSKPRQGRLIQACAADFLSPLPGLMFHATGTHSWRCGLPSIAPPTLKSATVIDRHYRLTRLRRWSFRRS